jgi:hypothetical protein
LTGIGLITFRAQNFVTVGRMHGFAKRDEAVAWLVKQANSAKS